jgi:hypothetical protein
MAWLARADTKPLGWIVNHLTSIVRAIATMEHCRRRT